MPPTAPPQQAASKSPFRSHLSGVLTVFREVLILTLIRSKCCLWRAALLLLLLGLCGPVAAHNGRVALAYPVENITLDGDLSDWPDDLVSYPVDTPRMGVPPRDANDFEASFRVGYNLEENAFYLAVKVRDESFVLDGEDRVNMQWPTNRDACAPIIRLDPEKYENNITPSSVVGDESHLRTEGIEVAFMRDAETHYYEWRVSAGQTQNPVELRPGQVIGLAVYLADYDADGSSTVVNWGDGHQNAPMGLSDVVLVGGATAQLTGAVQWPDQSQAGYVRVRISPQQRPQDWVQVETDARGAFAVELPAAAYEIEALGQRAEIELPPGADEHMALTGHAPQGRALEVIRKTTRAKSSTRQGPWQSFGLAQGLVTPRYVFSMYHDRQDRMWFGAIDDLFYYDGREFVHFSTPEGPISPIIYFFAEDRRGHLWFGSSQGVFRYDGETFVQFTTRDGLMSDMIYGVYEDGEGYVWFGGEGGATRYDGERFVHFTHREGLTPGNAGGFAEDAQGRLYFSGMDGLSHYDGETFETFRPGTPDIIATTGLHIDRRGDVWTTWINGGITRFDGESFEQIRAINGIDIDHFWVSGVAEDHRGDMWFTTLSSGGGTFRYDGKTWRQYGTEDGLATNIVFPIYKDRHEGLWLPVLGAGLMRYDDYQIHNLTTEDGLSSNHILTVIEDGQGGLFLGTNRGLNHYDGETITQVDAAPVTHYWRSLRDSRGHLWFTSRDGVHRYDGVEWRTFTTEDGLADNSTLGITEDGEGNIWVALNDLSRYDGKSWKTFTVADGLASRWTGDLAVDDHGNLWIGRSGGVDRFAIADAPCVDADVACDGKEFTHFDLGKDFAFGIQGDVHRGRDGTMFFASWGGLVRYDGAEWRHFTTDDGLLRNNIKALLHDSRGRLWMGGYGSGVAIFDGLVFQHLLQADGLASDVVQQILERKNGEYAIATEAGLTLYRPSTTPPTIRLAGVIADRDYGVVDSLEIASAQTYLRFAFEGTSLLTSPERMAYVYRLRGFEEEWQVTRDEYVEYGALPQGDYTFEVKAVDRDLNYSAPVAVALAVHHRPVSSSVSIDQLELGDLFASFYKSYAARPLGTVVVTNHDLDTVATTLRFFVPGLMRRPLDRPLLLAPQSVQEVMLTARLESSMLDVQDNQVLSAEVSLAFSSGDETISIQKERDIQVYGRGALQWDDVARAAAFVTAGDAQVAAFARQSLVAFEDEIQSRGKPLANLTRALVLFEALKAHGLRYLADANSPYAQATSDRSVIDHIQYPAELLKSKSGDCDDLTVLYASLLENAGVPTALVDYPGHIFLLFDTGVTRQEAYKLPMEERQYVVRGDRVWIPVEITRLDEPFAKAWKQGLDELARLSERDRRRLVVDTAAAWERYAPVSPAFGDEVEVPERSVYEKDLLGQHDALLAQVDQYIEDRYIDVLEREPDNEVLRSELGRIYVALRQYDTAISAAYKYLRSPGGKKASTYNHLGIVSYFKGELDQAAFFLQQALDLSPEDEGIRRNLEKVRSELGEVEAGARTTVMVEVARVGAKGAAVGEDEDSFYWVE